MGETNNPGHESNRDPSQEVVLSLWARRAEELMTPTPTSIEEDATVREAARVLTDSGFSALPVISAEQIPVGVISNTDIARFVREYDGSKEMTTPPDDEADDDELAGEGGLWFGFHVTERDLPTVHDIMTPVILCVKTSTPTTTVISQLIKHKIHRLFVVDNAGTLVGVISALDVVRHLQV